MPLGWAWLINGVVTKARTIRAMHLVIANASISHQSIKTPALPRRTRSTWQGTVSRSRSRPFARVWLSVEDP